MTNGRLMPNWPSWRRRAIGAWVPTRIPTAECSCAICACQTFTITPVEFLHPVPSRPGYARAGTFLRDVVKLNQEQRNFRIFGPDETLSNLLGAVFEATNRQWDARNSADDEFLARRTRHGLDAQRAPVRGVVGRLPVDRATRAVQQL